MKKLTVLVIFVYLAFVSCNNTIDPPKKNKPQIKKGVFSYTIYYPAGAVAEITLQKWPDLEDITLSPTDLTEGNGITETLELEAGSYLLSVQVSKTGLYADIDELVHIYSGVTTEYIKEFDDEGMIVDLSPVVNDYTINGIGIFIYDGSTRTVDITRKEDTSPGAITIFYNETETPPVNVGTYTVTFNVAEAIGWSAAKGLPAGDIIIIPKLPGAAVGAPALNDATQNNITINPVTPPDNKQTVEYGINTSNTAPSTWQTGLTFTGLNGGVYYIFARSAENSVYTSGAASASLTVMIVTTTTQWDTVLAAIRNGGDGTIENPQTYTVMVFGNVAVSGSAATDIIDGSASFGSVQYIAVTLKGSGVLSLNSGGSSSILRPGRYQTLIIDSENLTLQGCSGNNATVIYVQSNGTLELKNGVISGNTGGGVSVFSNGTFTMSGGEISGNTTNGYGGGVYLNGGVFTMSGGAIRSNTAIYGGGVYIQNGSFIMTGGVVYGSEADPSFANTASYNGGAALYVSFNSSGTAQYGNGSNILPHTDRQSMYTDNTINGNIAPGFVQEVLFTGQTKVINLDNLIGNVIYLVKVNTSNSVVNDVNTGGVHAPSPDIQNTGKSLLSSGEELPRMGHPAADAFSANPPPIVPESPRRQRATFVPPVVGDTRHFWVETSHDSRVFVERQATLRAIGQYGNIWIMNENFGFGSSVNKITNGQAQTLAGKFDLIYPLETKLLGYEYGGGPGGDGGKDSDPKVQILIYDIGSNVAGYFWGKDFYDDTQLSDLRSNLAEIFYIDAGMVIHSPNFIYSALVHEFQHMINFNQKTVKRGISSAVWYNEMLSLMTEDVIAPLIDIGPASLDSEIRVRMPTALNNYYLEGITEWSTLTYTSYATKFAFGAYLMRNYGGAELLQKILANNTVNIASITSALNELSGGWTFEQALKRYGEAMIFSGSKMPEDILTFDRTVTKTINGTAYTAYGFDVWNEFGGPKILDLSPMEMRPHSIMIHSASAWKNRTGNFSITLNRPFDPNVVLYLMVR